MKSLIFNFEKTGVPTSDLFSLQARLTGYRTYMQDVVVKGVYVQDEASLLLPSDVKIEQQVEETVARFTKNPPKYVVVVGIGGSNLGTFAIYEALFGTLDSYRHDRFPKLLFLDTTSTEKISAVAEMIERECASVEDFVINIISKSGGTTETIVNFELLYDVLQKKFGDMKGQIVVTTDGGSPLWVRAQEKGFVSLPIPKAVGGRYSVFSTVGLFPLGLAGVSIRELLDGAKDFRNMALQAEVDNPALVSAATLYYWYTHGISISNNFFFAPELESVGKWYRQLVGESLGKEHNVAGDIVHAGITPIVSIGSTDLHSMAQLYFGGPRTIFTTLISIQNQKQGNRVQTNGVFTGLVQNIEGKTAEDVTDAILSGVRRAYTELDLPFMTIEFSALNAYTLGAYMQYKMMETMFLAKLMQVNAFDQPNVERYKTGTKEALLQE